MRLVTLLLLTYLFHLSVSGQNIRAIEFSFLGRNEQHGDYVSNFANRTYNDTNKLYGTSYGVNIIYRQGLTNTVSAYIGIGYYRLAIDKISGSMPFNIPGIRTSRNINYDDGMTNLLYSTSKYHYNNMAATLGLNKVFLLRNNFSPEIGVEGICYYTISQQYRLLDGSKYYSTNNTKPVEFGVNMTFGILKEYKHFYIRPAILVPVYQNLKGDKVFYENRQMNISNWFNGFGAAIRIGKYIIYSSPSRTKPFSNFEKS
jgi:hypothetical protein